MKESSRSVIGDWRVLDETSRWFLLLMAVQASRGGFETGYHAGIKLVSMETDSRVEDVPVRRLWRVISETR